MTQPTKVDKARLITILKENLDKHTKIFLEAQESYREAVIHELDSMLKDARAGKKIRKSLTLIEPVNQTKDYDTALKMLEMSLDDTVTLHTQEFQQYVLDDWSWKQQFTTANIGYSKTLQNMGD